MAITLVSNSAWTAGTTSVTPPLGTHAGGDMLIATCHAKPGNTAVPPVFACTTLGWTQLVTGNDGSGTAQGADAGQVWTVTYYREAASSNETSPTITVTNGNVCMAEARVLHKTNPGPWSIAGAVAGDTTSATSWSTTASLNLKPGDRLLYSAGASGNASGGSASIFPTASMPTFSATGFTFGTVTSTGTGNTNNGNDMAAGGYGVDVLTGTQASVNTTVAMTLLAAQKGVACYIVLREPEVTNLDLLVDDAVHAHTADQVTLTQNSDLGIADSVHAHLADVVSLTQASTLGVDDSAHAHLADNVTLVQALNLAVDDAVHGLSSDQVTLSQSSPLVIHDASHALGSDTVTLTQAYLLGIDDAVHAHAAEELALTQTHNLGIHDASHALTSNRVTLTGEGLEPVNTGGVMVVSNRTTLVTGGFSHRL